MYHLSVKVMKRQRTSVAAAISYRVGFKLRDPYDLRMRYPHRNPVEILSHFSYNWRSQGMSTGNPADYQQMIDNIGKTEQRCNSRLLREIVVALPAEGTDSERLDLLLQFLALLAALFGVAFVVGVHRPPDAATGNHHAHIGMPTRQVDRDAHGVPRLGKKVRSLDSRTTLKKIRKVWEECLNGYYTDKGIKKHVSCESNKTLGLRKIPTVHEGPQGKHSQGHRTKTNGTIRHLNSIDAIDALTLPEAMEMIPAYLKDLEKKEAENKELQRKLQEEISKNLQRIEMTKRQKRQLDLLLADIRKVIAVYRDPEEVADALKQIVLRGGSGGGTFDRLRRSLPPQGGDQEIAWARDGIAILSSLFDGPRRDTLAKLRRWTAGSGSWAVFQPQEEKPVPIEDLLEYLLEENEFMPPDEEDQPPPPPPPLG